MKYTFYHFDKGTNMKILKNGRWIDHVSVKNNIFCDAQIRPLISKEGYIVFSFHKLLCAVPKEKVY